MFGFISGKEVWLAHPWWYVFWVTLASILIRAVMSAVRAAQRKKETIGPLWIRWTDDLKEHRYLVPTLVGTMELQIYPVLISSGNLQAIGWWLGIKIAGGWRWRKK